VQEHHGLIFTNIGIGPSEKRPVPLGYKAGSFLEPARVGGGVRWREITRAK
jgi:hypothetical protein